MITKGEIIALLPALILAFDSVLIILIIAIKRNHQAVFFMTVIGLATSVIVLFISQDSEQVTPLLVMDNYARYFIGLSVMANLFVGLMSFRYMDKFMGNKEEFYVLLVLETLGATILAGSTHFVSFFLGLEILSISLYGLLAYNRLRQNSIEAGIKYLILASVSSAFLLFGMALIYADVGTMSLTHLGLVMGNGHFSQLTLVGFSMLLIGIGFKLALVPFHMWIADVYEGAPAPATASIASVSKVAIIALVYRYFTGVSALTHVSLKIALMGIALLSMLVGNWLALLQNNVKRMLAYSSIAHMGYLMIPLFTVDPAGQVAVFFYMTAYVFSITGSLGVVTMLSKPQKESDSLEDYRSIAFSSPGLAAAFTIQLISLAGIPLTMGFVGKFYLFLAAVGSAQWVLTVVLVISSAIGLFYYLRLIASFFTHSDTRTAGKEKSAVSVSEGIVLTISVAVLIGLGVYPAPFIKLIESL